MSDRRCVRVCACGVCVCVCVRVCVGGWVGVCVCQQLRWPPTKCVLFGPCFVPLPVVVFMPHAGALRPLVSSAGLLDCRCPPPMCLVVLLHPLPLGPNAMSRAPYGLRVNAAAIAEACAPLHRRIVSAQLHERAMLHKVQRLWTKVQEVSPVDVEWIDHVHDPSLQLDALTFQLDRSVARDVLEGKGPWRRPQRRLVAKAVGGRLLSVTNAIEPGTCRRGGSGWALAGRPGGWGTSPPSNASLSVAPGRGAWVWGRHRVTLSRTAQGSCRRWCQREAGFTEASHVLRVRWCTAGGGWVRIVAVGLMSAYRGGGGGSKSSQTTPATTSTTPNTPIIGRR